METVTCIQFNLSGSIDGKVRIWGVTEKRVVNWVDMRDIITAICYRPDGKAHAVLNTLTIVHLLNKIVLNFITF